MGCRTIVIAFFAVVLLLGVAGAAMFHYLGWYALLVIPLVSVALFLLVRHYLTRIFLIPFLMKGKVLKGARTDVHEVRYLGTEEVDVALEQPQKQYAYLVDMTITPRSQTATPFSMWDPYELVAVPPKSKVSFKDDATDDSIGSVAQVSIFDDGRWQTEDFDKLEGASRLRIKLLLAKPSSGCKLRYYFYDVADLTLPPVTETVEPRSIGVSEATPPSGSEKPGDGTRGR
jgi:hypothetical protein